MKTTETLVCWYCGEEFVNSVYAEGDECPECGVGYLEDEEED